jgi:hypothetical protein
MKILSIGSSLKVWSACFDDLPGFKKKAAGLIPAADHHLDCASITAGRPLPEEAQEEAKAQAAINASLILEKDFILTTAY